MALTPHQREKLHRLLEQVAAERTPLNTTDNEKGSHAAGKQDVRTLSTNP